MNNEKNLIEKYLVPLAQNKESLLKTILRFQNFKTAPISFYSDAQKIPINQMLTNQNPHKELEAVFISFS